MADTNTNETTAQRTGMGKRFLHMILFLILFGVAETLLALGAVIQYVWTLFTGRRNEMIADIGRDLGVWMQDVVAFQTGNTTVKPFPWDKSQQ